MGYVLWVVFLFVAKRGDDLIVDGRVGEHGNGGGQFIDGALQREESGVGHADLPVGGEESGGEESGGEESGGTVIITTQAILRP